MKNILYYEPSSGFGGSSGGLYYTLKNLDPKKFNPFVVYHDEGAHFDRIKQSGFKTYQFSNFSIGSFNKPGYFQFTLIFIKEILPLTFRFIKFIRQHKIDLVHVNTNINTGIPAILAGYLTKCKIVCSIRESRGLIRREQFFARLVDLILISNRQVLEKYRQHVKADKVHVIYDGIDFEEFMSISPDITRKEFELGSNPIICSVARIVTGKGQFELVQAAKIVCAKIKDVKFILVGDAKGDNPDYYNRVRDLVVKENLTENIIFAGWRKDAKYIMASCDIFVMPTTTFSEGLPNAIIEAMALAKPIIGTDIPGPTELIVDQENGFIVPPGNIEAMAQKFIYLLEHTDVALRMGVKSHTRAKEIFNVKIIIQQLESFYNKQLS